MKIQDEKFEGMIGSDLERDGMYLEVADAQNPADVYFEIFYSDVTHKFALLLFKENI